MSRLDKESDVCPFLREPCIKDRCHQWVHLRGSNPQTGAEVDEARCAIAWVPIVMLECNKEVRQNAAAMESTRNTVTEAINRFTTMVGLAALHKNQLIKDKDDATIQGVISIP